MAENRGEFQGGNGGADYVVKWQITYCVSLVPDFPTSPGEMRLSFYRPPDISANSPVIRQSYLLPTELVLQRW
jgi:hypothetical protein